MTGRRRDRASSCELISSDSTDICTYRAVVRRSAWPSRCITAFGFSPASISHEACITVAVFRRVAALTLGVMDCLLGRDYMAFPFWPRLVTLFRLRQGAGRCGGASVRWPGAVVAAVTSGV
jgi:hypothetical protein